MERSKPESQSDEQTARRRDEALRRALSTPPKPHEDMKLGKGKKQKPKTSASSSAPSKAR